MARFKPLLEAVHAAIGRPIWNAKRLEPRDYFGLNCKLLSKIVWRHTHLIRITILSSCFQCQFTRESISLWSWCHDSRLFYMYLSLNTRALFPSFWLKHSTLSGKPISSFFPVRVQKSTLMICISTLGGYPLYMNRGRWVRERGKMSERATHNHSRHHSLCDCVCFDSCRVFDNWSHEATTKNFMSQSRKEHAQRIVNFNLIGHLGADYKWTDKCAT